MKNFLVIIFAASAIAVYAQKPTGLMTDLISHSEQTWQNGLVSNFPIQGITENNGTFQFAAITSRHPAFNWIVPGTKQATRQIAYRIILSNSQSESLAGKGNIWDSGETQSNQSTAVVAGGSPLEPNTNYFWRVKTKTNTDGWSDWSDIKTFRTASELKDFAPAFYPLEKTIEHPQKITTKRDRLFIDFGKDAFGQLSLSLTSLNDNDSIYIHLGECLKDGQIDHNPGGTIRYSFYPLALRKGTHTYTIKLTPDKRNTGAAAVKMPDYIGEVTPFRYVEIENYNQNLSPAEICRATVHYPFNEFASAFESSDTTLNAIWNLCKYSIKATSFTGFYVDGDRERIPYEADALINQLSHYSTDCEFSMARRTMGYLFDHPTWPTEWILQGVLIAWNDYLYTGDSRQLRDCYSILEARTLNGLTEKNGFISTTTGLQTPKLLSSIHFNGKLRDIVDWPNGSSGLQGKQRAEDDGFQFSDYNVVTNAFHLKTLQILAEVSSVLGMKEKAASYAAQASAFEKSYIQHFFNKKNGTFRDGLSNNHASLHGNAFPLALNLVNPADKASIAKFLQTRGMACSVYGAQFLLDALYEAGADDYALQLLTKTDDRSWYNMIRVGSTITLEAWDNKYKPNQDWNHAWGSAPANIIPRKLIGIEPTAPGFASARIRPQLGSLKWAKATVPTIRGEIKVSVTNNNANYSMELTIPANMEAEVCLPIEVSKHQIYCNGVKVKTVRVKDEPFVSLGKLPSGTWNISSK